MKTLETTASRLKIKSPTGCVHYVDYITKDRHKITLCHHNTYYKRFGEGFLHDWPFTTEPVTCKRCLKQNLRKEFSTGIWEIIFYNGTKWCKVYV